MRFAGYRQPPSGRWKFVLALMLAVSFGRPAMADRNGTFCVFLSAFYAERGQVRSHVVEVSTADFKHYSGQFSILTESKTVGSACAHPTYGSGTVST
jgi:hypothetical protein